ncbi:uncharacterized protein MAM_01828 [Metarhizium album ARSEF 1941]|uniref:Uncharacterized protein n=1 Tax=Metarhizium album (strain ARSEF 1941) TaxID=1081103 RepID=A0A0B2X3A7_METAS|nr:uncharacterized protein MAM_01828 [Metarhizium album ARSEF 1941]KHN99904.1 hypothetical protein MAM_01828 [Metarhizium album ARSEF 1941]
MGNICGKEEPDASPPGRVLGSAPAAPQKSTVPRKVGGPPRTLGNGPAEATTSSGDVGDARRKAAEAAEARAKASNKPGGKLQSQLSAQKRQSRADTLKQASAEEQRRREIANNDTLTYN